MRLKPDEQISKNKSINDEIHQILAGFSEPSYSRMLRKIRAESVALEKLGTEQADSGARHIFREFLVAKQLNGNGFCLEYSKEFGEQTPDWCDEQKKLLLEVYTCERGGTSDPILRVADNIGIKVRKYRKLIEANNFYFVVAVYGDFCSLFDATDCKTAIEENNIFEDYRELSGVIFFTESVVIPVKQSNSATKLIQMYSYTYFSSLVAFRNIDLNAVLNSWNEMRT